MQDHLPGDSDTGGHVSQAEGHGLMLDQRFTKTLALTRIVAGHFKGGAGHAH
ncbi:hypothetical protein D3C84_1037590 [compost metagenome]